MRGIETKIHYVSPLSDLVVARDYDEGNYINAMNFSRECLSLPIYPELSDAEVEVIARTVRVYFSG